MLLGEQYDATEEGYVDSEEEQGSKSTPNQQSSHSTSTPFDPPTSPLATHGAFIVSNTSSRATDSTRKPLTAVVGPVWRSYYPIEQTVPSAVISSPPYGSPQSPSSRPQFLHVRRVTDGLLNLTGNVSIASNSFGATSAGIWLVLLGKHHNGGQSTAPSACVWHKKGH